MDGYPPIAEHGLIGDLQTAALVTTDGSNDAPPIVAPTAHPSGSPRTHPHPD
jgi:hypothetical protein